jgi:hypothetical protein
MIQPLTWKDWRQSRETKICIVCPLIVIRAGYLSNDFYLKEDSEMFGWTYWRRKTSSAETVKISEIISCGSPDNFMFAVRTLVGVPSQEIRQNAKISLMPSDNSVSWHFIHPWKYRLQRDWRPSRSSNWVLNYVKSRLFQLLERLDWKKLGVH